MAQTPLEIRKEAEDKILKILDDLSILEKSLIYRQLNRAGRITMEGIDSNIEKFSRELANRANSIALKPEPEKESYPLRTCAACGDRIYDPNLMHEIRNGKCYAVVLLDGGDCEQYVAEVYANIKALTPLIKVEDRDLEKFARTATELITASDDFSKMKKIWDNLQTKSTKKSELPDGILVLPYPEGAPKKSSGNSGIYKSKGGLLEAECDEIWNKSINKTTSAKQTWSLPVAQLSGDVVGGHEIEINNLPTHSDNYSYTVRYSNGTVDLSSPTNHNIHWEYSKDAGGLVITIASNGNIDIHVPPDFSF